VSLHGSNICFIIEHCLRFKGWLFIFVVVVLVVFDNISRNQVFCQICENKPFNIAHVNTSDHLVMVGCASAGHQDLTISKIDLMAYGLATINLQQALHRIQQLEAENVYLTGQINGFKSLRKLNSFLVPLTFSCIGIAIYTKYQFSEAYGTCLLDACI